MSEGQTKNVSITGAAATHFTGGNGLKRARKTAKKNQIGGSAMEAIRGVPDAVNLVKGVEATSSVAASAASPNSNTWLKYPANAPVPPPTSTMIIPSHVPVTPERAAAPTNQYTVQQGGVKQIKVELKKKSHTKKVHLQPKKAEVPKAHALSKKHATKKVRKVTLGVSSLHKRMTRAKKLHKSIKEMPIDKVKENLVKKGLIKSTSKAPESVLRQIASDAEVVAKKAL
jgi:hypothetical protein